MGSFKEQPDLLPPGMSRWNLLILLAPVGVLFAIGILAPALSWTAATISDVAPEQLARHPF
jgi:hypothetical protein